MDRTDATGWAGAGFMGCTDADGWAGAGVLDCIKRGGVGIVGGVNGRGSSSGCVTAANVTAGGTVGVGAGGG